MGNIKLLIVDDHPFIRDGLRSALKRQANLIVLGEASNGSEAVKLARDFAPDLVVMDIYMPIMNGHEATRQIMRMLPDTNIIILSGDTSGSCVEEALQAGARGYLSKSGNVEELVYAISQVMGGKLYLNRQAGVGILENYRRGLLHGEPVADGKAVVCRAG